MKGYDGSSWARILKSARHEGERWQTVVVFVHGTGVREQGWANSFAVVKQRLLGHDSVISVHGCFWGWSEGAELKADGASIPDYAETRGDDPSPAEEDLALWAVLYTDPWYEIRLLGDWPTDSDELAPGQVSPSALLSEQIENFVPSEELGQLLASYELRAHFDAACLALRAAPEFGRAADAATEENLNEHRKAMARALVAFMTVSAEDSGAPPIDGATRDKIVVAVIDDLHGYGMGIGTWLTRPFKGVAQRTVTRQISPKARRTDPTPRPRPPVTSCAIRHVDQASDATSGRWSPTPSQTIPTGRLRSSPTVWAGSPVSTR